MPKILCKGLSHNGQIPLACYINFCRLFARHVGISVNIYSVPAVASYCLLLVIGLFAALSDGCGGYGVKNKEQMDLS